MELTWDAGTRGYIDTSMKTGMDVVYVIEGLLIVSVRYYVETF